jgi:tetratricopeptide (TPR) repeat protein
VIPAETLYGPEAVKRFMGVDGWGSGGGQARNARPEGERRDARGEADDEKAVPPRGTNAEAVALGRRFIAFGDAQFVKQKYPDALQRYKKAAQAAPALADAWFRQGYAYVAGGRYEQAVNAFKQGLKLDPGWPRSAFSNTVLYGDNRAAEMAHLEALAKAADQDRNNADLLLLVGIYLHFGRQPERAQPFFQRAVQLAGGDADHLQGFVAKAEN